MSHTRKEKGTLKPSTTLEGGNGEIEGDTRPQLQSSQSRGSSFQSSEIEKLVCQDPSIFREVMASINSQPTSLGLPRLLRADEMRATFGP
ncbi:hypothetical protein SERLA73DRAFT_75886 [Serpula lacrymans var. lacrymans S7.3]|uniref:Uncharacterized protein n=2 Tax=Serpula lacrymans var. lacrymans TaxID=341189 RepID=F8Q4I7_SERL3|nr:uncharacterized protein SERLADRAFT_440645 [Serpula lacrymans var. lacrymans S7.9]EGN97042.1 hypothetical protein SERLA73DRAFT_75886 [Serpula lacrymans var. lacrymans S7.3]EGO22627.1 hypothetical protein SERLADRAFT_440645 [Serpula lacrymans var. lacrymans S7.9]